MEAAPLFFRGAAVYKFGKSSESNLIGVYPPLVSVVRLALSYRLMDMAVVNGVRTDAEQAAYHAQGRFSLGRVNELRIAASLHPITAEENKRTVTKTLKSMHLLQPDGYGHAVDLVPFVKGRMDWGNIENFYFMATLMLRASAELNVPVRWGGHFRSIKDSPHFETI